MGFVVKAVKSIVKTVVSVVKSGFLGIAGLLIGGLRKKGNAKNKATDKRLSKQLDPEDFRKIVFGETAMAVDLRYWEVHGPKFDKYAEVLAAAGHQIESFGDLYLEEELVPFSGNNATGTYAGVLTRKVNTGAPGNAAIAIGSGTYWNSSSKFLGTAHYGLDWIVDDKKLPNGIPSRYTQVGKGALVYDPRKDSTRGGSGTHRANDQTTWQYSPVDSNGKPIGRNNALQMLWYLIGWKVQNPVTLEWTVTCGRGVDLNDINFADFIAAANDAEAMGYYSDMILSTGDDHESNEAIISADGLFGEVLDPGGLWTYQITRDDTADIAVHLTDDDIVDGEVTWDPQASNNDIFNEIGGTYIDPSATSLYQPKAYPTLKDSTYLTQDGGRRERESHSFQSVQDPALAQKLARIKLNRTRFTGEFQATFNLRALKAQAWSVVSLSVERYGFVTKLFRVVSQSVTPYGIEMVLREEHASIYAGGTVTVPAAPSAMAKYDVRMAIAVDSFTATASSRSGAGGAAEDGVLMVWATPPGNARRTEAQYKRTGDVAWAVALTSQDDQTSCFVGPLLSSSAYELRVRHVSIHEVPGPWATATVTTGANGRVTWAEVTGTGRPANNATVGATAGTDLYRTGGVTVMTQAEVRTAEGIALTVVGQGSGALANNLAGLNATEGAQHATFAREISIGDNLIRNSSLRANDQFWAYFNNKVTRVTGSTVGDPAAYFHHNVSGGGLTYCYPNLGTTAEAASCIPNALYRVEWRTKAVPITVHFQFYNAAGTLLETISSTPPLPNTTDWHNFSMSSRAPATASKVFLQFVMDFGAKVGDFGLFQLRTDVGQGVLNSTGVIPNPDMIEEGADGRPNGWFSVANGAINKAGLSYHDAAKTMLRVSAAFADNKLNGTAFRVETNTKYNVHVRMKAVNSTTGADQTPAGGNVMYVYIAEYDSELPSGVKFVSGANDWEPGGVAATRVVSLATQAITGTLTDYLYTYTPTSTAKWASFYFWSFLGTDVVVKRILIVNNATLGARAGTNTFRSDGTTVMTQAELRTAEGIALQVVGQGGLAIRDNVDYATHVVGATRPANNATVGAAWGTNLTGRPVELTDGRIVDGLEASGDIRRALPTAIGARQSASVTRALPRGARIVNLRDGDAYTFPVAWGSGQIPSVQAYNNGYIDASNYLDCKPLSVTATGFTADCKKVGPGTLTLQTENTSGTPSAPRVFEHVKQLATEAHDDVYTFTFNATVTNLPDGEPGLYEAGSLTIGLWTYDGATWQLNGSVTVFGTGGGSATTAVTGVTGSVARDGMGANDRFGISVELGTGSISAFTNVKFNTTSGNTITSATPTNFPGIPFLILGGTES